MHRFTIHPANASFPPTEVSAPDAGAVFSIVERLGCGDADVMRDGAYYFSLQLSKAGMWTIFQNNPAAAAAPPVPDAILLRPCA